MSDQIYKCPMCGNEVEELPMHRVLYGEFYNDEPDYVCRCGEDFDTASRCKICNEWTCDTELHDNLDVCEKCAESLKTFFNAFKSRLTDEEWGFIVDYMDEENLL